MTPKIKNITMSEFDIRVTVLIEFGRDDKGKIIEVRDVAFPTEDEMMEQVAKRIPDDQKGDGFDIETSACECPAFVVAPDMESFLESWSDRWKEEIIGDALCQACKHVKECFPDLAHLHTEGKGEVIDVEAKEEKPKKQKTFKIALD